MYHNNISTLKNFVLAKSKIDVWFQSTTWNLKHQSVYEITLLFILRRHTMTWLIFTYFINKNDNSTIQIAMTYPNEDDSNNNNYYYVLRRFETTLRTTGNKVSYRYKRHASDDGSTTTARRLHHVISHALCIWLPVSGAAARPETQRQSFGTASESSVHTSVPFFSVNKISYYHNSLSTMYECHI